MPLGFLDDGIYETFFSSSCEEASLWNLGEVRFLTGVCFEVYFTEEALLIRRGSKSITLSYSLYSTLCFECFLVCIGFY